MTKESVSNRLERVRNGSFAREAVIKPQTDRDSLSGCVFRQRVLNEGSGVADLLGGVDPRKPFAQPLAFRVDQRKDFGRVVRLEQP